MQKRLLFLLVTFLAVSVLAGGCGPSAEDFDCARNWLQRAKNSEPRPSEEVIQDLDRAIRAAEARDLSALTEAMDDARMSLNMTLARGDFDHVSPDAKRCLYTAMECIGYCSEAMKLMGECP